MKLYQDRLAAGLEKLGWRRLERQHNKRYVIMGHNEQKRLLFVGRLGAIRAGRTISDSVSIGDPSNRSPFWTKALYAAGWEPEDFKDNDLVKITTKSNLEQETGRVFDRDEKSRCIYVQVPQQFNPAGACTDDGIREVPIDNVEIEIKILERAS